MKKEIIELTIKQYDIAETLKTNFTYINKIEAIKFINSIFGSTATLKNIIIAYNSIEDYA